MSEYVVPVKNLNFVPKTRLIYLLKKLLFENHHIPLVKLVSFF